MLAAIERVAFSRVSLWSNQLHCALFTMQCATVARSLPYPAGVMLKVIIWNQESFDMQEQPMSKNARLIGYTLGAIVAGIAFAWKFFSRQ